MIYKDFIAEAAQKLMAAEISQLNIYELTEDSERLKATARGSVVAAKQLAAALEEDFENEKVDGGIRRYAEGETFFDNYVNWTKTK